LGNSDSIAIDEQPQEGSRALSQGDTGTIQTVEGVNVQGHIDSPPITSFRMDDQSSDVMDKSLKKEASTGRIESSDRGFKKP